MRSSGALGLLLVLACGCQALRPEETAATYKGGRITRSDYRGWLDFANLEDEPAQRTARLGQIAMGRVLSAALLARGGDREPAVAGQLVEMEESVLSQALRRHETRDVKVGEAEVDAALRENDKDRHRPRRVQLANLFKRVAPDAGPAARQAARSRLVELRRQILAGADFAALARRESDSETRFRGGRMGVAEPGQLPPHLEQVAFQLREGEVSQVLEHAEGFTLLKCLHVLPEETMSVEEARSKLRRYLESRAHERRWEDVQSSALASAPVTGELPPDAIRAAEPSQVIARFGERAATRRDVDRWMGLGPGSQRLEEVGDEVLRGVIQSHARQHAAAARARQLGLAKDPEIAARLGWERLRILATAEMARRVEDGFQKPTEEDLRARFESTRERRVQPERFRASVLRFGCGDRTLPDCSRSAEAVVAWLRSGELSFAAAAREHSNHPSSTQGGDLGWRTLRSLAVLGRNVASTIQELEVGATSPLLRQDDALWVVKLACREPERPQSLDEARPDLERELGNEQARAIQKRIQEQLLADLAVEVSAAP